jgi:hypothetical protein
MAGIVLPFMRDHQVRLPWKSLAVWFPWWWTTGNLAVFSCWAVSKPNYFVPCLPGVALLVGMAWIRMSRVARASRRSAPARLARLLIQLQWLLLLVMVLFISLGSPLFLPNASLTWMLVLASTALVGLGLGWLTWRRGGDVTALVTLAASFAVGVLIAYGMIAPSDNANRGHRELARRLEQFLSPEVRTVRFVHEIDEGLWFYLRDYSLAPVPGTQPRYSESFDNLGRLLGPTLRPARLSNLALKPRDRGSQYLREWLDRVDPAEPYLLMRDVLYDHMAFQMRHMVTPLYRETGMNRSNLILLQIQTVETPLASKTGTEPQLR